MAVTIPIADATIAIRAATSADDIPAEVTAVIKWLFPAASALVVDYAPQAPNDMHNAAVIRLTGWLYDADPTDPAIGRALSVSGAAALLHRWRVHRAGVIGGTATPAPGPAGPSPPAAGTYILTSQGGALIWVAFPLPAGARPTQDAGDGNSVRIAENGELAWLTLPLP